MKTSVFIDANKLIQFGKDFSNSEALTFIGLIKSGFVDFVTTDLTIAEVAKRRTTLDMKGLDDVWKDDFKSKLSKYFEVTLPEISKEEFRAKLFEQNHEEVLKRFNVDFDAAVYSINEVEPMEVLDDYTHARGLFGESSKKDQFPDAFILASIKKLASDKRRIVFITDDGDFKDAVTSTPHLEHVNSFKGLMSLLEIEPATDEEHEFIEEGLRYLTPATVSALDQYIIYANDVEDAELEIQRTKVLDVDLQNIYKTTSEKGAAEDIYLVYADVSCLAYVTFSHPEWDTAIWDGEDKVLTPWETVSGAKDVEIDAIPFAYVLSINAKTKTIAVNSASVRGNGFIYAELYPNDRY